MFQVQYNQIYSMMSIEYLAKVNTTDSHFAPSKISDSPSLCKFVHNSDSFNDFLLLLSSTVVLGEFTIAGTLIKAEELANVLQVCLDSGAKKILLPITSAADLGSVPSDLIGAFSLIFYSSPEDAVFRALGVE